ncbi:MAG: hypothetical protein ACI4XP_02505 [Acutalibacteraceae bacterium]
MGKCIICDRAEEKGVKRGYSRGRTEGQAEIIRNLMKNNKSVKEIAEFHSMQEENIEAILNLEKNQPVTMGGIYERIEMLGEVKGKQQGRTEGKSEFVVGLIKRGKSVQEIAEFYSESEEKINAIIEGTDDTYSELYKISDEIEAKSYIRGRNDGIYKGQADLFEILIDKGKSINDIAEMFSLSADIVQNTLEYHAE